MTVIKLGYFRELSPGSPEDAPSLRDVASQGQADIRHLVADYLDRGQVLVVSTSWAVDVLSDQGTRAGRRGVSTDGAWVWPTELSYYVRTYNIALPKAFIEWARAASWVPRVVSDDEVDALSRELFPGYPG